MTFYLPFLALLIIPGLIVLPALWNRTGIVRENRVEQNAAVASERMREFSNTDHETRIEAEAEIKSALLEDTHYYQDQTPTRHLSPRWAVCMLLFLPLFAIPVYTYLGSIQLAQAPAVPGPSDPAAGPQDIANLLAELESRLEQEPDNIRGWQLAAETYMAVGQYDKAVQAYQSLDSLAPGLPDHLAGWADATIMASGNVYTEAAENLVMRALMVDPGHQQALWLSALGASSVGDFKLAIKQLETLLSQVQDEPDTRQLLQELIASNQESMKKGSSATPALQPSGKSITVHASAIPRLVKDLSSSTTVFVIAKAVDGPPAPLAVSRHRLDELPLTITLTREHAMIEELNIENVDTVEVLARISLSGNPMASAGDIQSEPVIVRGTPSEPIRLEIGLVVP